MNKIITSCLVVLCLVLLKDVSAQQDAMYTQHMFQPLVYNPAYAGSRGALSTSAIYRKQWTGIDGAPTTFSVAAHGPMGQRNSALGIMVENDVIGQQKRLSAYVSYAYHIPFNRGKLSLGIQGGVLNFNDDLDEESFQGSIDPSDPAFQSVTGTAPNFGAGVYYYSDYFFLGVGVPHILNNTINEDGTDFSVYTQTRHYYATTGLILPISNSLKLRPTALLKYVEPVDIEDGLIPGESIQAPIQADITVHLLFNDALWLGVAARTGSGNDFLESVDLLLEYQFNQRFRLGYAYDIPMTDLTKGFNHGSHELMVGYDVYREKSRVLTPRYF